MSSVKTLWFAFSFGLLAIPAMSGCAWTPRTIIYPDGMTIAQVDQHTLDSVCSKRSDYGMPIKHAIGCYSKVFDIIYVRADCEGAKALPHELAHRQGITQPSHEEYDW